MPTRPSEKVDVRSVTNTEVRPAYTRVSSSSSSPSYCNVESLVYNDLDPVELSVNWVDWELLSGNVVKVSEWGSDESVPVAGT